MTPTNACLNMPVLVALLLTSISVEDLLNFALTAKRAGLDSGGFASLLVNRGFYSLALASCTMHARLQH